MRILRRFGTGGSQAMSPDMNTDAHAPDTPTIDQSTLYQLLGNERRMNALVCLAYLDQPVDVGTLASYTAAVVTETNPPPTEIRHRLYGSLAQTHLPRLHDKGIVHYNTNRKMVESGPHFDRVLPHLPLDDVTIPVDETDTTHPRPTPAHSPLAPILNPLKSHLERLPLTRVVMASVHIALLLSALFASIGYTLNIDPATSDLTLGWTIFALAACLFLTLRAHSHHICSQSRCS